MPWQQSDAEILRAAIISGKGAKTIEFSDQAVTFHSLKEMTDLLSQIEAAVASAAGRPRMRFATTSKGV